MPHHPITFFALGDGSFGVDNDLAIAAFGFKAWLFYERWRRYPLFRSDRIDVRRIGDRVHHLSVNGIGSLGRDREWKRGQKQKLGDKSSKPHQINMMILMLSRMQIKVKTIGLDAR
jgi:hypothetical protein